MVRVIGPGDFEHGCSREYRLSYPGPDTPGLERIMSERSSVDLALLPKQSFIEIVLRACTRAMWLLRRPFLLHRVRQPVIETIAGRPFLLLPEVQNPVVFRSGAFFAEMLAKCDAPLPGARALDLGTGSGICAIFAAQGGYEVV